MIVDLRDHVRKIHARIIKIEAKKYDLRNRHERQEYDSQELHEKQRQQVCNR